MRQLVVLLVSVTTIIGGIPLRAFAFSADQDPVPGRHRHYILRAAPEDVDAIAARHGLYIERRDETGSPIYIAASAQDPDALKAQVALDSAVLSFEEDKGISVPETTAPTAPTCATFRSPPSIPRPRATSTTRWRSNRCHTEGRGCGSRWRTSRTTCAKARR